MKTISKQLICISIIFLLVGVSYTSAIRIDNKTPDIESEKDCNCKDIDNRHLVRLEKQLNRLEVYSKLLLVLSIYNPELREISEELLDIIQSINQWDFPIICSILWAIAIPLAWIDSQLLLIMYKYPEDSKLYKIADNIRKIIMFPLADAMLLLILLDCDY